MAKFIAPSQIYTGPGCLAELPEAVAAWKVSRATLVVGKSWAKRSGYQDKVIELLGERGIETAVFSEVPTEPPCRIVDQLRGAIKSQESQLVVGMGGGSVLDAAKAAAILVYSDQPATWHVQSQKMPDQSLPVVAIPTTAGSGSEATPAAVLTIEDKKMKQSIRAECMMPRVAMVDPELAVNCSPAITAVSGMDAFVQAIEAFCSRFATHLSDALTEKAISLISKNLVEAFRDGTNISARQAMAEGSLFAGMALANVRLGAVHGLAHPIGGKYGIAHGVVCAVLLPAVLEFNRSALYVDNVDKYAWLCNLLMADPIEFTRDLLRQLGLPQDLREYKIPSKDYETLAEQAVNSGSTKANPRPCSMDDILDLIKKVV